MTHLDPYPCSFPPPTAHSRDIKPENVVFASDRTLKLIDLGLSINLNAQRATTRLGTLVYTAPEVLTSPDRIDEVTRERHGYSEACDAWSVGCLLHELLTGNPPFQRPTQLETYSAIVDEPYLPPVALSGGAQRFLRRALAKDPEARPTMAEMLADPWLERGGTRESLGGREFLDGTAGGAGTSRTGSPTLDPFGASITGRLAGQLASIAKRDSDPTTKLKQNLQKPANLALGLELGRAAADAPSPGQHKKGTLRGCA